MAKLKNNKAYPQNMDKRINCPRCSTVFKKQVMRKIKHPSGAVLDVCDHCGGMWLDRNEVKLLYHFSKKQISRGKK